MKHSLAIKHNAGQMRRDGISIPEIAGKLGIAKSTVSVWVSPIPLPKNIRDRLTDSSAKGAAKGLQVMKARRELIKIEDIREAEKNVQTIINSGQNKYFWRFCAALIFWCEGSKRHLSGGVVLANSDPQLVKLFLHALRSGFEINEKRFAALIHLHEYHDEKRQLKFWSKVTQIPLSQFMRSYKKPHTRIRQRENYPGCISLRYRDAALARKLDALYHAIAKI